jgi:hypothetical protein
MARGNRKGSPGGTGGAPPQIISRLAWRALTANMLEPIAGNLRDQADAGPVPLESRGNRPKEHGRNRRANSAHGGDDDDRDQCGDERVFDGRDTGSIVDKAMEQTLLIGFADISIFLL